MNLIASFVVLVAFVVLIDARSFRSFRHQRRDDTNQKSTLKEVFELIHSDTDLEGFLQSLDEEKLQGYRESIINELDIIRGFFTKIPEKGYDMDDVEIETDEQRLLSELETLHKELPNADPRGGNTIFLSKCYKEYMEINFKDKTFKEAKEDATNEINKCLSVAWESTENEFIKKTESLVAEDIAPALKKLAQIGKEVLTLFRFEETMQSIDAKDLEKLKDAKDNLYTFADCKNVKNLLGDKDALRFWEYLQDPNILKAFEEWDIMDFAMKVVPRLYMHSPGKDDSTSNEDDNTSNDDDSTSNEDDNASNGGDTGASTKRKWMRTAKSAFSLRSPSARTSSKSNSETKMMLANLLRRLQQLR